jgi:hypothetical protein
VTRPGRLSYRRTGRGADGGLRSSEAVRAPFRSECADRGRWLGFSASVTFEDAPGITVVDVEAGPGPVDSGDHGEVDRQALVDD